MDSRDILQKVVSELGERWAMVLGAFAYLPSSLILARKYIPISDYVIQILSVTIVPSCFMILIRIHRSNNNEYEISKVSNLELSYSSQDMIITEYEQICEEIRMRQSQITNSTYFVLAALGLLVGFISNLSTDQIPFVIQFGFYITLSFTFLIEEKIDEMRVLRSKQRNLENMPEKNPFTISEVTEPTSIKGYLPFNTEDHTLEAFWFLTILWACGSLAALYLIGFNFI